MRIAIPLSGGILEQHFGHCEKFALIETDAQGAIRSKEEVTAPEHQPGLLPVWLKEKGVTNVIAGNMGSRARTLFADASIAVFTGARGAEPETLAAEFLAGTLESGTNRCDH
jgi:predicted Fe-Mo cluster-binding NifX family protein